MRSFLPIVLTLTLLGALGCDVKVGENGLSLNVAQGKATDDWVRTYSVSPGGHVEIVNDNGEIGARVADGTMLEVHAAREVRAESDEAARALMQKLQMVEEVGPDHVRIQSRGLADDGGFGRRSQASVKYDLRIPRGMGIALQTQNGGIVLENLEGQITATTTNGGITGRGLSGSLRVATVNGGVQAEMVTVTGEVSMTSVNGGVRLALPPGVKAQLEATAVNGGVTVDDALHLAASERGRLHVVGMLNGGGLKISLQTTNGGVRVTARAVPQQQSSLRSF
jgi:hypothetical protein